MAGLTGVGSGAAALSGSEKTPPTASTVDALSTSRLENFLSRMAFAPNRESRASGPGLCTGQRSMQLSSLLRTSPVLSVPRSAWYVPPRLQRRAGEDTPAIAQPTGSGLAERKTLSAFPDSTPPAPPGVR